MRKEAKQVRKVLDRLRSMNYWQRIMVMNWLKDWYEHLEEASE